MACEVREQNFTYMLQYFSSYHKLQRSVTWWMRFIKYLKMCKEKKKPVNEPMSVTEQEEADTRILQGVQQEECPEEVKAVKMDLPVKTASKLASLCPVYENGLLKVGSRQPSKHPVILLRHHITDLFMKNVHKRNGRVDIDHCHSYLSETVYILQSYSVVKKVVQSCYQCKKQHKRPMQQQMAPLPAERTNEYKPVINIGVDFFGPMYDKHGRGTAMCWGCLFTCLTTRAVHIEVAHSLSADSFIMAFQRFVARRGKPAKVWSGNGTNFTAGEKELRADFTKMNTRQVEESMLMEAIEWKFIPAHTPHMGGVWERLVRSIKRIFKALVNDKLLTDEELKSYLCEAEKIMNDRPLKKASDDPKDLEALTPNHILLLRRNNCQATSQCNNVIRRR